MLRRQRAQMRLLFKPRHNRGAASTGTPRLGEGAHADLLGSHRCSWQRSQALCQVSALLGALN